MGININLGGNIQNLIVNNSPAQRIVVDGVEVWPESTDSQLDFTLTSNLTQPLYLTQSAANAVTVDWGDGSSTESPSNLSASLSHTYAEAGDYTVRIACADGETWSPGAAITSGSKTTNYGLCGQGGKNGTYPTLTGVRFGNGMRLNIQNSFYGCTSLTNVIIPSSITSIGINAFSNCTGLMNVTIPDSVTNIDKNAFNNCRSLTSVTIPESVTSIGDGAFYGCSGLINMTIPGSVLIIPNSLLFQCSLHSLILQNGVEYIGAQILDLGSVVLLSLPNSVFAVHENAFQGALIGQLFIDMTNADINFSNFEIPTYTLGANVEQVGQTLFGGYTKTITVLAPIPPILAVDALRDIPADCAIYVPSASVVEYQAASGWSDRAAYIQAIAT